MSRTIFPPSKKRPCGTNVNQPKRTNGLVYVCDTDGEHMTMWSPPTPPQDDNDLYIDQTLFFIYEPMPMTETQLPPVYVKREIRKPKAETISRRLLQKQANTESTTTSRKMKQRKEEAPRVPHSLFARPTASVLKLRKELKLQRLGFMPPGRSVASSSSTKPVMDISQDHPEWLIHEDWALLQAVQTLLGLPFNLTVVTPGHIPNWDLVSDVVNSCSRVYRSPKQCKVRYNAVIIPREEGKILYDINPRKPKKSKGIYKDLPVVSSSYSSTQTKNNRPMKTSQLYLKDNLNSVTLLHSLRFDSIKSIATKRTPTLRPMLVNPTQKNPKHVAVLADSGITYDTPLNPEKVAAIRAERIQQEKKKGTLMFKAQTDQLAAQQRTQAAQQAQPQQPTTQATPVVATAQVASQLSAAATVLTGSLQKTILSPATVPAVSISRPIGSTGNIIVNTAPGVTGGTFAAINKRMSQQTAGLAQVSTVKTLSPQTVGQAVRAQHAVRGATLTMQDLTTAVNQAQARANIVSTKAATVVTTSLTAAQLSLATQRTIAGATSGAGVTSVQQQLAQATKPLTQAQLTQLQRQQQQTILKQGALHQRQILSQKIPFTGNIAELRRQQLKQQQLKQLQSQAGVAGHQLHVTTGQKQVLTSQLVTAIGQKTPVKQIQRLSDADLQALIKRQQASGAGHVQQVNLIAPVQQVGQGSSSQTPVATLVKAPGVSNVTLPVTQVGPLNINVSTLPGQKVAGKSQTVSPMQQHRINNLRILQRNSQGKLGVSQVQQVTGKGQLPLGAIQLNRPVQTMTIQQFVKHQQQQGQGAAIQQIITSVAPSTQSSQPTIIATVTQAQPMVANVSLATAPSTTQTLQTITQPSSLTLGSQVSVTTQPSVATLSLTAATAQTTQPTATVQQPVIVTSPGGGATVHMQPIPAVSVSAAKLTGLSQTVNQQIAVGRNITQQTPSIAAQQVVVTATNPESPVIQTQIQRPLSVSAHSATLLTGQHAVASSTPQTLTPAAASSPVGGLTTVVAQTPPPVPPTSQTPPVTMTVVGTPPQVLPSVAPAQTPSQIAGSQQAPVKTAHYAMRTRQPPKH